MILDIDLVSDFVCPWCFIGKTRLDQALAGLQTSHPDVRVRLHWLPFLLNPDTPPAGEPYRAFLEAKFGGARQADELLAHIASAAGPDGPAFAFERIRTRPNTLNAHRLCYRAQSRGMSPHKVQTLAGALFAAHFQHGLDIGDPDTLADLAAAQGERRDEILAYLASDEDADRVRQMAASIRRQGVSSVPFFIFNRKLGVSGAQSAAALGAALLQALDEPAASH
jgi:predicted DsbA family dithiol-disulfide isomerase